MKLLRTQNNAYTSHFHDFKIIQTMQSHLSIQGKLYQANINDIFDKFFLKYNMIFILGEFFTCVFLSYLQFTFTTLHPSHSIPKFSGVCVCIVCMVCMVCMVSVCVCCVMVYVCAHACGMSVYVCVCMYGVFVCVHSFIIETRLDVTILIVNLSPGLCKS